MSETDTIKMFKSATLDLVQRLNIAIQLSLPGIPVNQLPGSSGCHASPKYLQATAKQRPCATETTSLLLYFHDVL